MASILKVDTLTGVTTAGSISVTGEGNSTTTNLQQGLAKAWANATATATVNDSLNVSAGTDHGTGDYTLTVTNSFTSLNYAMTATGRGNTAGHIVTRNVARGAAGTLAVEIETDAGAVGDFAFDCNVHGDLA
tara:strand:+ start:375 stop:770 length:396 start_codon:yes stop_codon:yes gene_type:complete